MYVKIKTPKEIEKILKLNPGGEAQKFFTSSCKRRMERFVPMRKGTLRDTAVATSNEIIYNQDYATYQYFGMRQDGTHKVRNYTTPGTGSYWDKRMLSVDKDVLLREVVEYVRRNTD